MYYIIIPAVFLIGVLTKFTDLIVDDGLKLNVSVAYATGIIYGIMIAYVVVEQPLLAPLGLAVVIAVLLTKKIDRKPHITGIVSLFLFLCLWGFPKVNVFLLIIFLIAGAADEVGNDLSDRRKVKGILAKISGKRIVLEITAFLVSLTTGHWIIFLSMLAYDSGYLLTGKIGRSFL